MKINMLATSELRQSLERCCSSDTWVELMLSSSPFEDEVTLLKRADQHWGNLEETDYLQAFSGHPKIGDLESLQKKYAATQDTAASEQSGMDSADEETIKMLALGNRAYESKFAFIFIVCATGKSAAEMLNILEARLVNDRESELANAAEQQRLIFQIRLKQLI